jgi:hypothetical protein
MGLIASNELESQLTEAKRGYWNRPARFRQQEAREARWRPYPEKAEEAEAGRARVASDGQGPARAFQPSRTARWELYRVCPRFFPACRS